MSFFPSVAGAMARVRVFGVKRAFTGNENAMRISRLYQKVNGLEPNEKATINSVYLYEAALALHHLLNTGKAFSIDKELKELNSKGVRLQLDSKGTGRIHASYNIYELGETFTRLVAVYQNNELLEVNSEPPARSRGKRATPIPIPQCPPAARGSDGRRHFRAYAVVEPPMIIHTPREPVSGFMVDVMDYLSQALDFTYNITLLGDGHTGSAGVYGTVTINETTGEVNATGLIGLVYNCKADLAIGSLAISIERQKVIDFSKPWHDYGLILMAPNPAVIPSSIWSCFSPFSVGAWMLVLTALVLAILSVPIMIALTGRPFYGTLSDDLDRPGVSLRQRLYDSLWFLFSTGLGWGPDGANLPVRIILAGFFAFMLVATSTYTANLAAFLTAVQTVTPVASVDKLASQTNIPFGTVRQTAVEQAFLTSTLAAYKDIGNFMQANPEYMVDTVQQGIDLVKGSTNGYVFIWDSPTLEYYAEKKPCTAQVVGRTFMEKSYAIGMPKGMPYRADFSGAILKMRAGFSSLGALARAYLTGECAGLGGGGGGSGASGISVIHIVGSVTFMFLAPLGLSFVIGVAQRIRRDCRQSSGATKDDDGKEESRTNAPATVIGMNDVSNQAKATENENTNE
ncbi:glutamate receptor 2-like [Oscarella lobularis]|uniref:glutamate receptor 2-like n=1 Tax=Oscarella lobularis TaxID=121494 RepID=UPI003313875B